MPWDQFLRLDYTSGDGQYCTAYKLGLKDSVCGQHKVVRTLVFTDSLHDGTYDFPIGQQVHEYNICLKPKLRLEEANNPAI